MLLRAVECRGYKAFRNSTRLALRPITVLFGKNNSGKTTLARLPVFAIASIANRDSMYALSHEGIRFGSSFADLGSIDQPHPRVSIGLEWSNSNRIHLDLQHVTSHPNQDSVQPARVQIDQFAPIKSTLVRDVDSPVYDLIMDALPKEQQERFSQIVDAAQQLLPQVVHIPSMRPKIELTYPNRPPDSWSVAEVPFILASRRDLLNQVDTWVHDTFDGASLTVDLAGFAFQLTENRPQNSAVNLADSGRGLQSSLPVAALLIGLADRKRNGSFIVLEEPEAHLHPSAHGAMADLVIASSAKSQIVVETHSENFILRLRRCIAEGGIKNTSIGLYYLNEDQALSPVPIDNSGGIEDWPAGVFESDIDEARAIIGAKVSAMRNMEESGDS